MKDGNNGKINEGKWINWKSGIVKKEWEAKILSQRREKNRQSLRNK